MTGLTNYEYYKELYEERAAIRQYDAGFPQQEAERKALWEIKVMYLDDNNLSFSRDKTYGYLIRLEKELKK